MFSTRTGRYLAGSNVARVFKKAAKDAGVVWASMHSLRHMCATELLRRGLNAQRVQVWMGHHSPAFTLAVYVHYLRDDLPESPFGEGHRRDTSPTETSPDAELEVVRVPAQVAGSWAEVGTHDTRPSRTVG